MKKFAHPLALIALAAALAGCGAGSAPTAPSATLDNSPPQAPLGLAQGFDGSGDRVLSWTPNSEADLGSYQIYQYSPDPGRDNAYVLVGTVNTGTTQWSLPASSDFEITWMRMRAVDQTGNLSAVSAPCRIILLADNPGPDAPPVDGYPVHH